MYQPNLYETNKSTRDKCFEVWKKNEINYRKMR